MDRDKLTIFVGFMALIIYIYRLIFIMSPMFKKGIITKNVPLIFKSFTLLT